MSAPTAPDPQGNDRRPLAPYRKALFEWNQRLCAWLGLDPELLLAVDKRDPEDNETITVTWRAIAIVTPKHGRVISRAMQPFGHDSALLTDKATGLLHSGTAILSADEAADADEQVGPKPEPYTPAERERLTALFLDRT